MGEYHLSFQLQGLVKGCFQVSHIVSHIPSCYSFTESTRLIGLLCAK